MLIHLEHESSRRTALMLQLTASTGLSRALYERISCCRTGLCFTHEQLNSMNTHSSLNRSLTRRAFVRRTALATGSTFAGPLIVPSRVLGLGGEVAPSNRITLGFIGTGRQATYANIPGFLREPDAQAVAVCDVDSWRLDQAHKQIEDFYA